jgi:type I restriction enzyme S subunit
MVEIKFKNTDIGLIPEDWKIVKLRDSFTFKNGLNKEKEFFGYGFPIVNYMDVYKNTHIDITKLVGKVFVSNQELKNFNVNKGDVLFTRTSETQEDIGSSAVITDFLKNTVFSGFVLRARPFNNYFDIQYCRYVFSNSIVREQIKSTSTYTTRALTNGRVLSEVKIPLPPIPEQKAIAEVLSDTDTFINSLENLIVKKRLIKQGAMQMLLTPKKDWKVEKLGTMSQIYTGNKNNQDKNEDGLYPFFVRSQKVERINTYSYEGEAILIPGEGNLGSIFHYINGKFDFHQRVYKVSNFIGINGKYLYWYFRVYFGHHALQNSVKATVDSIRLPTIQEFEISFPPIKEQIRIANLLSDMDAEIDSLEKKLFKVKDLKQGLMQQLLTGKTRLINTLQTS